MKRKLITSLIFGVFTWLVLNVGSTAGAQPIKLSETQIQSVDSTNLTFSVAVKEEKLTVFITSETRLFKNGDPATTKALVAGEMVRGALRKTASGRVEAVRLHLGEPKAKAKADAPKSP